VAGVAPVYGQPGAAVVTGVTGAAVFRNPRGRSSFLKKRSKRLLHFQAFVPLDRCVMPTEESLLVFFFRNERLA
jgi:hypothetical protein